MSKEELTRRAGLAGSPSASEGTKPILMQLLESFISGDKSPAAPAGPAASSQQRQSNASPVQ